MILQPDERRERLVPSHIRWKICTLVLLDLLPTSSHVCVCVDGAFPHVVLVAEYTKVGCPFVIREGPTLAVGVFSTAI